MSIDKFNLMHPCTYGKVMNTHAITWLHVVGSIFHNIILCGVIKNTFLTLSNICIVIQKGTLSYIASQLYDKIATKYKPSTVMPLSVMSFFPFLPLSFGAIYKCFHSL